MSFVIAFQILLVASFIVEKIMFRYRGFYARTSTDLVSFLSPTIVNVHRGVGLPFISRKMVNKSTTLLLAAFSVPTSPKNVYLSTFVSRTILVDLGI